MRIGKTKEKIAATKNESKDIKKKRNLEDIGGFAFNTFYRSFDTKSIIQNTLANLAFKYEVYFDYDVRGNQFIVTMNEYFLYEGSFDEMEILMQKGVKSYYQTFWSNLVEQAIDKNN